MDNKNNQTRFIIYGCDGYPSPCQDFYSLKNAIKYGIENFDLFSVKNLTTRDIDYSNYLNF